MIKSVLASSCGKDQLRRSRLARRTGSELLGRRKCRVVFELLDQKVDHGACPVRQVASGRVEDVNGILSSRIRRQEPTQLPSLDFGRNGNLRKKPDTNAIEHRPARDFTAIRPKSAPHRDGLLPVRPRELPHIGFTLARVYDTFVPAEILWGQRLICLVQIGGRSDQQPMGGTDPPGYKCRILKGTD